MPISARQVTTTSTTPIQFTSTVGAGAMDVNILNRLASDLYLGGATVMTTAQAFPLATNASVSIKVPASEKLYGFSTSTGMVPVIEVQW